ncbi:baseplate J/gp47 family protein [Duganella dendranthematis]|uniref:Baseplate J/gp47 family protein n=1 Tax=Duganella dendranthematis TaxID=2728021 RepID=A0ABX6MD76_9BURK|nr:baseplate J/gp47 family protein [Duganella dendranthematis]QJD91812.1 baseplate J/gp47 family protein [Duganella dendranthematis]
MPYARPTLSGLQETVASDIAASLKGSDALLRFSNLGITGRAQAGLANMHYGYLDWIAKQAVPFTCTDEFLEGWAALKGVFRQPPTSAAGVVTFSGAAGKSIPVGAGLARSDGVAFVSTSAAVVAADGTVAVPVAAVADPAGLAGAFGNTPVGATMTLSQSIAGIQSTGAVSAEIKGGADLEGSDSLRSRMLAAYQQAPQGGGLSDYESWAKAVPGVTRAWCVPNGFGVGTVVIFTMFDEVRASGGGFPQGTDGVAAAERRGLPASGDQLVVANVLYSVQAVVGLVYAAAPTALAVDLTIQGLPPSVQSAASAAVAATLLTLGRPGGTIPYGALWSAIATAANGNAFTVTPTADIVCGFGQLPVVGTISYGG